MSEKLWLYTDAAGLQGPVTEEALATLVRSGELSGSSSLREDVADGPWAPLSTWLPDLAALPPQAAPSRPGSWTDTWPHPWRRYLARMLDNMIVGTVTWMLIAVVFFMVAPVQAEAFFTVFEEPYGGLVDLFLTILAAIPGNALMIGLTGTSIGKWIFGVKIVRKDGRPIGFLRALKREMGVWLIGLGAGIPLVSLITLISSYNALQDKRTTAWDTSVGSQAFHRREGVLQTLLVVLGVVLVVSIRLFMIYLERL